MTEALSPRDLTVPQSGTATVRALQSRYLALQARDLMRLRLRGAGNEPQVLATLQRRCRELAARGPVVLATALQRCTVGAMIRFLAEGAIDSPRGPEWVRHLAALLYAELALAGSPPPAIVLSPPPARLFLPALGTAYRFPGGSLTARLHEAGVTVVGGTGAVTSAWKDVAAGATASSERASEPVRGRVHLALVDDSPLAAVETHPDKAGNRLDLGGRSADAWCEALRNALDLVERGVPAIADEIDALIQQLVPVGFDAERHLSASFRELVGTVYLSLHPDPLTLAEALIHEHSHNKLNMLWTLAPVLDNGFTPLYSSPFRPDPRPLHGVLLGVHAFLPIELLYERLAEERHPVTSDANFARRRSMLRERNARACEMLRRNAQATETGQSVLDEIFRWNRLFA